MLIFKVKFGVKDMHIYTIRNVEFDSLRQTSGRKKCEPFVLNIISRSKYTFSPMSPFNEPESVKLILLAELHMNWA